MFLSILISLHQFWLIVGILYSAVVMCTTNVTNFYSDRDSLLGAIFIVSIVCGIVLPIRPAIFSFVHFDEFFVSRRTKYVNRKVDVGQSRILYSLRVYLMLAAFFFLLINATALWVIALLNGYSIGYELYQEV